MFRGAPMRVRWLPLLLLALPLRMQAEPLRDLSQAKALDSYWTFSTPQAEGLDPARLESALKALAPHEVHSFMVIRHGRIVLDAYGRDREAKKDLGPDDLHELHSVTKSVTSTLLAIAQEEGRVPGFEAKAMDWFAKDGIQNPSVAKSAMTLADLITMRSGLQWEEGPDDPLFFDPPNAAKAILDRPITGQVGTTWKYSSGNSQILGEILRRATGQAPRDYADARLFGPLGITNYVWKADKAGTSYGGWGLFMRPRDLARFGYLCLKGGVWKGKRLVSEARLKEATRPRCTTPWGGQYAYHWWVPEIGGFAARGYLGQMIYAFPDQDLLIVVTANLPNEQAATILDGVVKTHFLTTSSGGPKTSLP